MRNIIDTELTKLEQWMVKKCKRFRRARFRTLRQKARIKKHGEWQPIAADWYYQSISKEHGKIGYSGCTTKILYKNIITNKVKIEEIKGRWSLKEIKSR